MDLDPSLPADRSLEHQRIPQIMTKADARAVHTLLGRLRIDEPVWTWEEMPERTGWQKDGNSEED